MCQREQHTPTQTTDTLTEHSETSHKLHTDTHIRARNTHAHLHTRHRPAAQVHIGGARRHKCSLTPTVPCFYPRPVGHPQMKACGHAGPFSSSEPPSHLHHSLVQHHRAASMVLCCLPEDGISLRVQGKLQEWVEPWGEGMETLESEQQSTEQLPCPMLHTGSEIAPSTSAREEPRPPAHLTG